MIRQNVLRLTLATVVAVACGGAGGSDSLTSNTPPTNTPTNNPPASPNTVTIADNAFNPTAVTVNTGTAVTWKWAQCTPSSGDGYGYGSTTCPTHNVTFDDGTNTASQTQDAGDYTRVFSAPGTYKYHCSIHGAAVMSGEIVVK